MVWFRQLLRDFAAEAARSVDEQRIQEQGRMNTFWVAGDPATFATPREQEWKETLARALPAGQGRGAVGLALQFVLKDPAPRGYAVDLDNLCEPVFSVLVNRLGWFKGRRPDIRWWHAAKKTGEDCGVLITVIEGGGSQHGYHKGYLTWAKHISSIPNVVQ